MSNDSLLVVAPPNNDTWPEVYIYQALLAAGAKEFMPMPQAGPTTDYTSSSHFALMMSFGLRIGGTFNNDGVTTLLYAEAYTALPTYYRSIQPMLPKPHVEFHVALGHGGSFIPGDVMAWDSEVEALLLEQYDLIIVPSEYHYQLQFGMYPTISMRVARWPLNADVHDLQEQGLMPRSERVPRIIFPHRQIPEKGWDEYQQAFSMYTDGWKRFDFISTGKRYSRPEYLALLADCVAVYANATMETYGVAVEEAMALGCCPVLNHHPVYEELYGECGVHWHDGTPEDIVRAARETETCDRVHYNVNREVSDARSQKILDIASEVN